MALFVRGDASGAGSPSYSRSHHHESVTVDLGMGDLGEEDELITRIRGASGLIPSEKVALMSFLTECALFGAMRGWASFPLFPNLYEVSYRYERYPLKQPDEGLILGITYTQT